jgi:predicted N-formylglutamate amidohydrolase
MSVRDWPEAVEILNPGGASPLVLVCEHASNYIPPQYHGLGLGSEDLARHIAWDIGAADVTHALSERLDAPAFLGTYSRLLVDLNRPPDVAGSMTVRSEATDIPGNASLSETERANRIQRIFVPFQSAIAAHMQHRERVARRSLIVCIHSFTPVYLGQSRPWHIGVLFDQGVSFAQAIISGIRRHHPSCQVDANVPYGVAPDADYALLVYGDYRGNPATLIEIRHDLIATRAGADLWAGRLAEVLTEAASA